MPKTTAVKQQQRYNSSWEAATIMHLCWFAVIHRNSFIIVQHRFKAERDNDCIEHFMQVPAAIRWRIRLSVLQEALKDNPIFIMGNFRRGHNATETVTVFPTATCNQCCQFSYFPIRSRVFRIPNAWKFMK